MGCCAVVWLVGLVNWLLGLGYCADYLILACCYGHVYGCGIQIASFLRIGLWFLVGLCMLRV